MLVKDKTIKVFDLEHIKRGTLVYAKHETWPKGKTGLLTDISDTELTVQYHPDISNVMNHFFLPVKEVIKGEWEVKWSNDLKEIYEYQGIEGRSCR